MVAILGLCASSTLSIQILALLYMPWLLKVLMVTKQHSDNGMLLNTMILRDGQVRRFGVPPIHMPPEHSDATQY